MTEEDAFDSLMAVMESIEVSLKRIADAMEVPKPKIDEYGDYIK